MTKHIYMKSKIQVVNRRKKPDEKSPSCSAKNRAQLATREQGRDSRRGRDPRRDSRCLFYLAAPRCSKTRACRDSRCRSRLATRLLPSFFASHISQISTLTCIYHTTPPRNNQPSTYLFKSTRDTISPLAIASLTRCQVCPLYPGAGIASTLRHN